MSKRVELAAVAALTALLGVSSPVLAQGTAPAVLPMQGFLTDGAGTVIDGDISLAITLYDGELGTTSLYTETQTVMVDAGHFAAYVGDAGTLDLAIFRDNSDVWVGLAIDGGTELPRFQLGSVPYAAFAQYANVSSNTLQLAGAPAADYALAADAQARVSGTCPAGQAITAIAADGTVMCRSTGGITGGACPVGQVIRAIDTSGAITCTAAGTGTITGVSGAAGSGITGGGASGAVALDTDPNVLQRRVSGTCPAGQAIRAIAANGTVTCQATSGGAIAVSYFFSGSWTSGTRVLTLPGYGYVELTGTAGQFRIVASSSATLMYNVQPCENCVSMEGTIPGGGSFTTTTNASTYDQIRIVIQFWNGTGTATFIGTRAGSICSGFAMSSI